MTAVYTLYLPFLSRKKTLLSKRVIDLTFVIPVFNDSSGLRRTLESIKTVAPGVRAVVVDDGSDTFEKLAVAEVVGPHKNVTLIQQELNKGAGHARNVGAAKVFTNWIAFVDCDCELSVLWYEAFKAEAHKNDKYPICICGPVKGDGTGIIPMYMEEQGILNPPMLDGAPQTIVTANAIVWRDAFVEVGCFSEQYPGAGGEDFDLGFKLFQIGHRHFASKMAVAHRFSDCLKDFSQRFFRYGRANKLLEMNWGGDFRPVSSKPESARFEQLSEIQYLEMLRGYNSIEA